MNTELLRQLEGCLQQLSELTRRITNNDEELIRAALGGSLQVEYLHGVEKSLTLLREVENQLIRLRNEQEQLCV